MGIEGNLEKEYDDDDGRSVFEQINEIEDILKAKSAAKEEHKQPEINQQMQL